MRYGVIAAPRSDYVTVSGVIQMLAGAFDTISEDLLWALVVIGVIVATAVVSLLRK